MAPLRRGRLLPAIIVVSIVIYTYYLFEDGFRGSYNPPQAPFKPQRLAPEPGTADDVAAELNAALGLPSESTVAPGVSPELVAASDPTAGAPLQDVEFVTKPPAATTTKRRRPRPTAKVEQAPLEEEEDVFRWQKRPEDYPVSSLHSLPEVLPTIKIPKIQAPRPSESREEGLIRDARRDAVRNAFLRSWDGYKENAWMHDEVAPLSGKSLDPFGGWAATLVDSLDTLWIMGLEEEFDAAVTAATRIDFTTTQLEQINLFETVIRYLGGFLAAFELSEKKYPTLLEKAIEVGQLVIGAFDTPNRMPISRWYWKQYVDGKSQIAQRAMLVSELGSFSLEFTKLSQLTGDMKYYDAVQRIADVLEEHQQKTRLPGMWPVMIAANRPSFNSDTTFTLGGMSDSLYEYLPKQWLLLGGALEQPRKMYEDFIGVAKKALFRRAINEHNIPIIVSGDAKVSGSKGMAEVAHKPRGQHLTCFAGGMVGLASRIFNTPFDLDIAIQLTDGCVWAYNSTASGIMPEVFTYLPCGNIDEEQTDESCAYSKEKWYDAVQKYWHISGKSKSAVSDDDEDDIEIQTDDTIKGKRLPVGILETYDKKYILRPEAIESVFIMYRLTADPAWVEKAWVMFEHIERHTKADLGAASLEDVTRANPTQVDKMESFWFAETLKYFYLMFSDWHEMNLDEWVLNTEAHPLKRPVPREPKPTPTPQAKLNS